MNKGICIFGLILLIIGIAVAAQAETVIDRNSVSNVGVDTERAEWIKKMQPGADPHIVTPEDEWDYYDTGGYYGIGGHYYRYGRINVYPNAAPGLIVGLIGFVTVVIGLVIPEERCARV